MTDRRLSVIVPARNEASCIAGLLDDLAPLRAAGHEVILADGGSTDRTREIARPRVDAVIESAPGRALQMNAGARAASGDLFWFLHADSRVPEKAASAVLRACDRGRQWGRFDVRLSGRHPLLRVVERMMNLRSCLTGIATGDQGIFVTRAAFQRVAGYPEIQLMEDIVLSRALRRDMWPVCLHSPRLLTSSRRWEQRGVVRTVLLMWRLRLAYALGVPPRVLAKRYR